MLLDDRGWWATAHFSRDAETSAEERRLASPGIWAYETVEGMEDTARSVVGPDGAHGNVTQAEADAAHWDSLASDLRAHGVAVTGNELAALPHDVELSDRVLARIGHGAPSGDVPQQVEPDRGGELGDQLGPR